MQKPKALGEIRFEHLFVDGTKIEANTKKYSFVWKKSVTKYEIRLVAKLERRIPQLCAQHGILAVTADAGYEREENYSYLEEKNIGCYIKSANYERDGHPAENEPLHTGCGCIWHGEGRLQLPALSNL